MSRITLKLYAPTGALETTMLHAPRLGSLAGKTICELSNFGFEHQRIFPAVREALQKRFPTAKFVPYDDLTGSKYGIENLENLTRLLEDQGCDAVIAGMAA